MRGPIYVPEAGLLVHPFEMKLMRVRFEPGHSIGLQFSVIDRYTRNTESIVFFDKPMPFNPFSGAGRRYHGNMHTECSEALRGAMRDFCHHEVDECIADVRDGRLINDPHAPGYREHGPSYR